MQENSVTFQFIQPDVFLIAKLNPETNKQSISMQWLDLETKDIIYQETINCIHFAVSNFKAREADSHNNTESVNDGYLYIESSENLKFFDLSPQEIFQALKSWVAGIAELGTQAFQIQSEIESRSHTGIPLSNRLLRFMGIVNPKYIFDFLYTVKKECYYEGQRHNSCLIANLLPVLEAVFYLPEDNIPNSTPDVYDDPPVPEFPQQEEILTQVFQLDPPLELFSENVDYLQLLQQPIAISLTDFPKAIHSKEIYIRKIAAKIYKHHIS